MTTMMFSEPPFDEVTRTGGDTSRTAAPSAKFRSISSDYTLGNSNNSGSGIIGGGTKASSVLSSSFSEWHPVSNSEMKKKSAVPAPKTTATATTTDYHMEMIMNDINSSLNLDDVDFEQPLRGRQDSSCSRASSNGGGGGSNNIWGNNNGAVTTTAAPTSSSSRTRAHSSASSSPTWGVIGETPHSSTERQSSRLGGGMSNDFHYSSTGHLHSMAAHHISGTGAPSLETVSSCSSGSAGSFADRRLVSLNNQKLVSPPGFRSIAANTNHWLEAGVHEAQTSSMHGQQVQASLDEYRQPVPRSGGSQYNANVNSGIFQHQQQHRHHHQHQPFHPSEPNVHYMQHATQVHQRVGGYGLQQHDTSVMDNGMSMQGQRLVVVQQDYHNQFYVQANGNMVKQAPPNLPIYDQDGMSMASRGPYMAPDGLHHHQDATPIMYVGGQSVAGGSSMMHHANTMGMPSPHAIPSRQVSSTTSIQNLAGQIRRLSRDQMGCRLLQQALMEDGPEAATGIFQELLPYMAELMMDPFGNYLFQKLLDSISSKERELLVRSVSPRLVQASLNLHGTRSVQKVIDVCSTSGILQDVDASPDEIASKNRMAATVAQALKPAASRLCIDSHGNHVMQRILSGFPPAYTQFIYKCVASSVTDVARHRHGCCVIQRCLDSHPQLHYITVEELEASNDCTKAIVESRKNLMDQICSGALHLMQDAYGNYVVQYVLDVCVGQPGEFEIIDSICETTIGRVSQLSIQKFSSNVIEKCLEKCSDKMRAVYLREITSAESMKSLMNDPFGNYVVQRALGVSTHDQAVALVEAMRPHLLALKNTAPGRRIMGKIMRRFPHFNLEKPSGESNFDEVEPVPVTY
jgi:hypothetical protein